jgi:16S rRNA (cytosine1402-N4)-methyltransferase
MDAAGHKPVLIREVREMLDAGSRKVFVDCTVGLAGHAAALLQAAGDDARLIGLDADPGNLQIAKRRLEAYGRRVRLFHANFTDLPVVLAQTGTDAPDALLADLGVSSTQLDQPQRGFGFAADGPLDMRMDPRDERTAGDLVNELPETALADVIYRYGEERYSRRIARAVVERRKHGRIETTGELAELCRRAYPAPARRSRRGVHPATRTFQALRIAVNDEMAALEQLLEMLPDALPDGARAAVISFHSLEDRRVKHAFADMARRGEARLLTRKPLTASDEEVRDNPRSRSAKLRGIERIASGRTTRETET